jgi:hypothetical protein
MMSNNEQLIAAAQQALEALESFSPHNGVFWRNLHKEDGEIANAITTLRTAIEAAEKQQALDKKAENARELGLDYEPGTCNGMPAYEGPLSAAQRPSPTAPVQEPPFKFRRFVAGSERAEDVVIERETTIEAAARKAMKICPPAPMTVLVYAPPAAPSVATPLVQEPVAWRYNGILHEFDPSDWAEGPVTPLYTTPPGGRQSEDCLTAAQRPVAEPHKWVNLTDEEIDKTHETQVWDTRRSYARAIEALSRERNGG